MACFIRKEQKYLSFEKKMLFWVYVQLIKNLFSNKPKVIYPPPKVTISSLRIKKKKALEIMGREYGIELDRRLHKEKLVQQLFDHIQKNV